MTPHKLEGLSIMLDPSIESDSLGKILQRIIGQVDILQLGQGWKDASEAVKMVEWIRGIRGASQVPIIVNNDIQVAVKARADGIQFDNFGVFAEDARKQLGSESIIGYTCGNDLLRVRWCGKIGADYIAFHPIYPPQSAAQNEKVPLDTIRKARSILKIPIFASGGITVENGGEVLQAGADGFIINAGLLKAKDPGAAASSFKKVLSKGKSST